MEDKGQILLYQTPDGESRIEVRLEGETVWLNQEQMAELFQRNKSTISRHINNAFEEGELTPEATVAFFATVQTEGNRQVERDIAFYNLDMIISVGYRDFLRISRKDILTHAGRISAQLAKAKADSEYDKFKERTKNELTPVEIHFIEQFEREQKKLSDKKQ